MTPAQRPATTLITLDEAWASLDRALPLPTASEKIAVSEALDRIASRDTPSTVNVPPFDNSAMDGYALQCADLQHKPPQTLHCVGTSQAGSPYTAPLRAGECVRIMTGASLPPGADAVVIQENTQRDGDGEPVTFYNSSELRRGDNIRLTGEDIASGDILVGSGRRITPADIGILVASGNGALEVYKKLRVAIFATGNELLAPGESPRPGAIYESNRSVLRAMLTRLNFDVLDLGIIPDEPAQLAAAFDHAAENCDAMISTGGASVGDADYTRKVFASLGELSLYKLAIKPGKPFCFGKKDKTYYFGLPGNPVSAAVTFHQLVIPALRKLSGEGFILSQGFPAIAENAITKRPGRTDFQRGVFTHEGSVEHALSVRALPRQSSGVLSSICKANCFIKIAAERGDIAAGESVEIIPFDRWIA